MKNIHIIVAAGAISVLGGVSAAAANVQDIDFDETIEMTAEATYGESDVCRTRIATHVYVRKAVDEGTLDEFLGAQMINSVNVWAIDELGNPDLAGWLEASCSDW